MRGSSCQAQCSARLRRRATNRVTWRRSGRARRGRGGGGGAVALARAHSSGSRRRRPVACGAQCSGTQSKAGAKQANSWRRRPNASASFSASKTARGASAASGAHQFAVVRYFGSSLCMWRARGSNNNTQRRAKGGESERRKSERQRTTRNTRHTQLLQKNTQRTGESERKKSNYRSDLAEQNSRFSVFLLVNTQQPKRGRLDSAAPPTACRRQTHSR